LASPIPSLQRGKPIAQCQPLAKRKGYQGLKDESSLRRSVLVSYPVEGTISCPLQISPLLNKIYSPGLNVEALTLAMVFQGVSGEGLGVTSNVIVKGGVNENYHFTKMKCWIKGGA